MRRLTVLTGIIFCAVAAQAQNGLAGASEHQLGDWRNFAVQTQVTVQLNPFGKKPNTVGSQFLFDDWVKGKVVNVNNVEFTDGLYNFNKITQNLYVQMRDTVSTVAFLVDRDQLKSISLTDGVQSYVLERVPGLDANSLYRALAKGNKYSFYSQVKTKFIAANYESNGIVSSGNVYDEYKDEVSYWVVFADGSAHDISLKKKSIKGVFEADKDKVDQYFKANSDKDVNEAFVAGLVSFLNQ